jgi:RimJ/RimL family protein N-acetyltransferase
VVIDTPRTRLRPWQEADRPLFAALHAHPEVMRDLGGPIDRAASDKKLASYRAAFCRHGFSRWAIETRDGNFLGYAGVMPSPADHPLGAHFQIGWRLVRDAWGKGYASEAAAAALSDAFSRAGLQEVVAYTERENKRSQAVMNRLPMTRDPSRDFMALQPASAFQSSGGRREAQGRTASKAADICSTPRSSKRRPTICRPTGRPSLVKPQGIDAAGFCDRLKG